MGQMIRTQLQRTLPITSKCSYCGKCNKEKNRRSQHIWGCSYYHQVNCPEENNTFRVIVFIQILLHPNWLCHLACFETFTNLGIHVIIVYVTSNVRTRPSQSELSSVNQNCHFEYTVASMQNLLPNTAL